MTDTPKILIAVIVGLVIGWFIGNFTRIPQLQPTTPQVTSPTPVAEPSPSEKNVIEITDTGFNPSSITIKADETVTWVSKATAPVWPAGDDHPTHDKYPSDVHSLPGDQAKSFGSKACIEYGVRKGDVFDSCRLLLPEQAFSFKFDQKGTWGFHNHVRPEHKGIVAVE